MPFQAPIYPVGSWDSLQKDREDITFLENQHNP